MTDKAPLSGAAITGNYQLTAQLPQGKTISFSGYIYEGQDIAALNAEIDIVHDAMDRQRTRAEIPELELVLESKLKRLEETKTHYLALANKIESGAKLTSQEKSAIDVRDINLASLVEDIDKGREKIAAARVKVGM